MTAPATVSPRLHFGSALFDDGIVLNRSFAWLQADPYRLLFPLVRR
jgi:hypothetical protein